MIPVGETAWWLKGQGVVHDFCNNKDTPDTPDHRQRTPYDNDTPPDGNTPEGNTPDGNDEGENKPNNNQEELKEKFGRTHRSERARKIANTILDNDGLNDREGQRKAYGDLYNEVGSDPLVWSTNNGDGTRSPKTLQAQQREFDKSFFDIFEQLKHMKNDEKHDHQEEGNEQKEAENQSSEDTEQLPSEDEDGREWYLKYVRELRKFCQRSKNSGQFIDTISMRPVTEGVKAHKIGIPLQAMANAITLHWSPESKETAGCIDFDIEKYAKKLGVPEGYHKLSPYIRKLAEARIPILLVGDKGTGKSYIAKQLSEELGLEFGYLSLNGATTPSWFFGNWTPDPSSPYKTRPLRELYRNGGVFCIDEIDAGEPNMLLVLNNLISSDILDCPMTGEKINKHPDFIVIATANTFGLGANKEYRGRERLDDATLDRFRMGRVVFTLDEKLERKLLFEEG